MRPVGRYLVKSSVGVFRPRLGLGLLEARVVFLEHQPQSLWHDHLQLQVEAEAVVMLAAAVPCGIAIRHAAWGSSKFRFEGAESFAHDLPHLASTHDGGEDLFPERLSLEAAQVDLALLLVATLGRSDIDRWLIARRDDGVERFGLGLVWHQRGLVTLMWGTTVRPN